MTYWRCWFRIQAYNFKIPTPKIFFGQIWAKNSKLSILPENWQSWYIGGADSESRLRILKFQPQKFFWANLVWKSRSCLLGLRIGTHDILKELILHPDLIFWNSDPKILFWTNLGRKFKVVRFAWKLAHMVSWRSWFCIRTQFLKILTATSIFGPIWAEKVKVVIFAWKLAHRVFRRCCFLFLH